MLRVGLFADEHGINLIGESEYSFDNRGNRIRMFVSGVLINIFDRGLNGHLVRSVHHGFYLFNARGDVVQLVNANGVVTRNYRYDAFGNEINPVANDTNNFRFAEIHLGQ